MSSSLPTDIASEMAAVAALCERHGVQSLHLFGSGSTPEWDRARSDFDFVVSFLDQPDRKRR